MNIEKHNVNMYKIIAIAVLAAILLTAFGGIMMQRQTLHSNRSTGASRDNNQMMQPESAQSGPTGKLVVSTGIILLLVGCGVFVVLVWAGRSWQHNQS